jgi:hypothetical protein
MPSWISGDDEAHCQGLKRLGRVDAHRAALNVPVNHDAASAVAAAAFMGCSGSAWEVAPARRLGARAIRVLPRQSQLELLEDRAIGKHACTVS